MLNKADYIHFTDAQVKAQLETLIPTGFTLYGINQLETLILLRDQQGYLVVYGYTAHWPDKLSSYYLKGSTHHTLRDMKMYFNNPNCMQDGVLTIHDLYKLKYG